ncbi:MAG: TlpA disulfide reductase family protein [Pseudomonadota bacterium]
MRSLKTGFFALIATGLMVAPSCADSEKLPDRGLVTQETPLPDSAKDSRDDGILRDKSGRPVTHPLLGQSFPEFEAQFSDGREFSSTSLDGQWTVMTIWGVWCHDSRNDAENIAAVAEHFGAEADFNYVSLHVPPSRERLDRRFRKYGSVDGYFEERGLKWPVVLDETADIREAVQISWTPTYLVIGPDRTVLGYRTDLSVVEGEAAISDFIEDVSNLRSKAGD